MTEIKPTRVVPGMLTIGPIHHRAWVSIKSPLSDVPHDSHDLTGTVFGDVYPRTSSEDSQLQLLSDRILIGEEPASHGFVDHHHPGCGFNILFCKVTTLPEGHLKRSEIA